VYVVLEVSDFRNCKTTERHDAMVVSCITKRQKAALDTYCWKNRIPQSILVRNYIETLITGEL